MFDEKPHFGGGGSSGGGGGIPVHSSAPPPSLPYPPTGGDPAYPPPVTGLPYHPQPMMPLPSVSVIMAIVITRRLAMIM